MIASICFLQIPSLPQTSVEECRRRSWQSKRRSASALTCRYRSVSHSSVLWCTFAIHRTRRYPLHSPTLSVPILCGARFIVPRRDSSRRLFALCSAPFGA